MLAFSALADPTRLRIVEMLGNEGQLAANQISKRFFISPPAISQHLKVLREANLIHMEIKAQQRLYALNPDGLLEIENWIARVKLSAALNS
jgi:DNA-binding transcriptional ArsR family regulator